MKVLDEPLLAGYLRLDGPSVHPTPGAVNVATEGLRAGLPTAHPRGASTGVLGECFGHPGGRTQSRAGQALARALTLVTHNTGEFQRVPGLRIEDWE